MHRAANPMPRHGRNVHGLLVGWVLARTPIARRHDARAATAFVPPGMKVVRSSSLHIAGFAREKINDEVTLEEARVNPMTVFAVQALLAAASRATPDEPTLELETIFGLNAQKFFVQVVLRTVVREDDPLDELAFTSQAIQRLDNVHLLDRNEIITDVVACAAHQQRSRALEAHGAIVASMPQAMRHHFTDGLPHMPVRVSQYVRPRGS